MRSSRSAPLAALLAIASCGQDSAPPDAPPLDMADEQPPPAPQLGAQLDRMGRPLVLAALVGLRDTPTDAATKQDAYTAAADPAMWAAAPVATGRSIAAELAANLALLDVLDKGANATIPGALGCSNQVLFNGNPGGGGVASATSYATLAALLADDMLYVDTALASCTAYLSLELEYASGGSLVHAQCGGRSPTHDVIDVSYSLLLAGLNGFTQPPATLPRLSDAVAAHADLSDAAFPYFGPPH